MNTARALKGSGLALLGGVKAPAHLEKGGRGFRLLCALMPQ